MARSWHGSHVFPTREGTKLTPNILLHSVTGIKTKKLNFAIQTRFYVPYLCSLYYHPSKLRKSYNFCLQICFCQFYTKSSQIVHSVRLTVPPRGRRFRNTTCWLYCKKLSQNPNGLQIGFQKSVLHVDMVSNEFCSENECV